MLDKGPGQGPYQWFEESLPLIASENLISPLAKEMLISDFHDRYAEGLPVKRYYQGNIYVDKVELKCLELARRIFKAKFRGRTPNVRDGGQHSGAVRPGETR
jgi:glycine hydroxymethyltransferase